ncbi:hypothetical protein DYB36_003442 [Aphanomyces astaci]|uniref:EGF-like domain-containing protein n=1 Tax=Aphanomyces astaci TaxID=112090 RepID=A0A396ZYN8_APHAT|nr:hypothetical protein DYB36_003442 [Aphanomyces astaci]
MVMDAHVFDALGAQTLVDVALTTTVAIPVGGSIRVTFPSGFMVTPTAITSPVGLDAASSLSMIGTVPKITIAATAVAAGTVSFTLNGVNLGVATFPLVPGTYKYTLQGITNPGSSCNQFYDEACVTAWENLVVSTLDVNGNTFQSISVPATPIIKSNLRFARVRTALTTPNTVTSAYVLFNTMTVIPVGGHIVVTFPTGFTLSPAGTVMFNNGINSMSTSTISGLTVQVTVASSSVAIQNGVKFTLSGVTTPPLHTSGSYQVQTTDSLNNVLEESVNIGGVGCRFLNDCSGHGDCTLMSSTCTCHPGFGASSDVAEYKAPDCSVRKFNKTKRLLMRCDGRYMSVRPGVVRYPEFCIPGASNGA